MEEVPESINSKSYDIPYWDPPSSSSSWKSSKNNNKNYDISYWDPPSRLRHGRGTGIYK
ncbi:hypothetical protein T11_16975 [Trichinella zimbabwensis]|uniref:Uncharacterized protein n=1 Tax=Trichinella zimbabwensis TaxID=268475 RepID=A0A0V1GF48_9BILA|nr:hypothetical protein T11_16975 [Trichinella zimbabwensis]